MFSKVPTFGFVLSVDRVKTEINCFNNILALDLASVSGSGSTRPDTNSARESTRPRVNSAGSTRPLIFPITGRVFYKYMMFLDMNNDF